MEANFKVKYFTNGNKFSHEHWESYTYEDSLFCPNCGKKSVWSETSGSDFYAGENYICVECGTSFNLPFFKPKSDNEQDRQRVESIKCCLLPSGQNEEVAA